MLKLAQDSDSFTLWFKGRKVLEHEKRRPCLHLARGSARYPARHGSFKLRQRLEEELLVRKFQVKLATSTRIEITFEHEVNLIAAQLDGRLEISFSVANGEWNRLWLRMAADPNEHIYGCGEQYTHLDLKGKNVPLWCEEQGIGRGRDLITLLAELRHGAGGKWSSTYFPQPTFVSSSHYFVHADCRCFAGFDFRRGHRHELRFWEIPERIVVGVEESAPALLSQLSGFLGRQPPLPEWVNKGVWLGVQGGFSVVLPLLEKAQSAGIPVAALWCQDWEGRRITPFGKQLMWNWEACSDLYPNLREQAEQLRQKGIRLLGYINPFLATEKNLYAEASQKGLLVKNLDGTTAHAVVTTFPAGMLDLSHPETQRWIKEIIQRNLLGNGLSGWMADFGEHLPAEHIQLHSGAQPERFHNLYPVLWARLNREAIVEAQAQNEATFFARAGHTGTSRHAPMVWAGDQLVNWSRDDGFATIIPAALSLGFVGIGVTHADIGGYTTVGWIKRSKELFLRWTEQAAFSPLMRTHEGNRPEANWQFHSDAETLAHFARMARVHVALEPYLRAAHQDYQSHGLPLMRHPFIHYEGDEELHRLKYHYLFGRDLLVAPVISKGKQTWKAYLPEDEWIHLWQGTHHSQGWCEVPAPRGEPPVFFRASSPWRSLFESLKLHANAHHAVVAEKEHR